MTLTSRQREVAILAADGLTDKAIAARLAISPKTVCRHLKDRVINKLGHDPERPRRAVIRRYIQAAS